jgi:integrase
VGLPKAFQKICEKAGIEDVSLHTLRHTFAAIAAEMGYSELTIAGLLGHSMQGVTARYAHVPDAALVSAADRISQHIADVLEGREHQEKVIPLRVGMRWINQ